MSLLTIRGLSKTFPGGRVLDEASLDVEAGEIHALVGQNGSGKSTLIKILARYHEPDPGARIVVMGREFATSAAHDSSIRFIHQDLGLVSTLSAVENLALSRGYICGRLGRIRWGLQRDLSRRAIGLLGMGFDVSTPVGSLDPSEQTAVAIARAMLDMPAAGILVLDEPTAALPMGEVQRLFEVMRTVASGGAGVLFVTHRIGEVLAVAHRVTVLRDGRVVATEPVAALDHDAIVGLITGQKVRKLYPLLPLPGDDVVLSARGLHGKTVRGVSFDVRRSEIVGFAGLTGTGREELARLTFGATRATAGSVEINGTKLPANNPHASIVKGMAFVPADRARQGAIPKLTLSENITLSRLRTLVRYGVLRRSSEQREVRTWIRRVHIRPPEPGSEMGKLSGGNQQKALLARSLRLSPRVLVLDEPTQGVDVGAKPTIYSALAALAESGAAIVICSSDNEELAHLCDRVVVLRDGCIAAELVGNDLSDGAITAETLKVSSHREPDRPATR